MKWNFFYDEGTGEPYHSFQDWYREIRYLVIPTLLMIVAGASIYCYFRYFHH
ncbi:hypothetical protein [Wandonia haliotis]|uniref:hypothetical protein n=1 Tax=Wandonia haliotis TaxID=574963 RepID=UPI0031DF4470